MIEQKLVDEMATLIENAETSVKNWHCRDTNCLNCTYTYCTSSAIAEELLEHYQPKLPEGSVVISKKEYELLTDISALKGKAQEALNINPIEELIQVEREARKQVVEDVLAPLDEMKVKEDDRHQWRENHNDCIEKCKAKIAKKFGVIRSDVEE